MVALPVAASWLVKETGRGARITPVMVFAAPSDMTAGRWAFDVSENLVTALVGGFVAAVLGKQLGVPSLARIPWPRMIRIGAALLGFVIGAGLAAFGPRGLFGLTQLVVFGASGLVFVVILGIADAVERRLQRRRERERAESPFSQTGRRWYRVDSRLDVPGARR